MVAAAVVMGVVAVMVGAEVAATVGVEGTAGMVVT
jgi:hypothetical protein